MPGGSAECRPSVLQSSLGARLSGASKLFNARAEEKTADKKKRAETFSLQSASSYAAKSDC